MTLRCLDSAHLGFERYDAGVRSWICTACHRLICTDKEWAMNYQNAPKTSENARHLAYMLRNSNAPTCDTSWRTETVSSCSYCGNSSFSPGQVNCHGCGANLVRTPAEPKPPPPKIFDGSNLSGYDSFSPLLVDFAAATLLDPLSLLTTRREGRVVVDCKGNIKADRPGSFFSFRSDRHDYTPPTAVMDITPFIVE